MMAGKTMWKIIPQNFMTFGSKTQVFLEKTKQILIHVATFGHLRCMQQLSYLLDMEISK